MTLGWPEAGPWVLVATSGADDLEAVAMRAAAASRHRVALVTLAAAAPPGKQLVNRAATWIDLREGATSPLTAAEAAALVGVLSPAHGLVLIVGGPALLVPLGRAGWTVADLATALDAPVAVVAGDGPDTAHHITLALAALESRGLTGVVIPSGVDPADLGFPGQPLPLPRSRPPRSGVQPGNRSALPGAPRTTSGKRVVLLIAALVVAMSLVAGGLSRCSAREESVFTYEPSYDEWRYEQPAVPAPVPATSPPVMCPENQLSGTPARPAAATTARVDAAWKRIEKWLTAEAPVSHRALRPPAKLADLDRAQQRMSVAFPPDLVASLLRHDGTSSMDLPLIFSYRPMPLDEITGTWRIMCDVVADPGSDYWNKSFIPFLDDGSGSDLLVDQRPGSHGRVGEFVEADGVNFECWPASVADLLDQVATSLETGRPYAGAYRPTVTAGRLDWALV